MELVASPPSPSRLSRGLGSQAQDDGLGMRLNRRLAFVHACVLFIPRDGNSEAHSRTVFAWRSERAIHPRHPRRQLFLNHANSLSKYASQRRRRVMSIERAQAGALAP